MLRDTEAAIAPWAFDAGPGATIGPSSAIVFFCLKADFPDTPTKRLDRTCRHCRRPSLRSPGLDPGTRFLFGDLSDQVCIKIEPVRIGLLDQSELPYAPHSTPAHLVDIGRASCRERGCQQVENMGVAGALKKKK